MIKLNISTEVRFLFSVALLTLLGVGAWIRPSASADLALPGH